MPLVHIPTIRMTKMKVSENIILRNIPSRRIHEAHELDTDDESGVEKVHV